MSPNLPSWQLKVYLFQHLSTVIHRNLHSTPVLFRSTCCSLRHPIKETDHMYIKQAISGIYHVRIRVPAEAQPILRRTELHCSLGTRNRREAEHRAQPIIARMRSQIFKAKAKSSGDQYRADILRARADSLSPFEAIDDHFEAHHPQHTLEQLKAFMAQLSAPASTAPSEPARTVLTAFSDLSPLTTIIDHNAQSKHLGKAAISQRQRAFDEFMHHLHAEGIYYLEHCTPDHWQAWCRSLYSSGLSAVSIAQRQTSARTVIRDYLLDHGRTFHMHHWSSIKLGITPRAEKVARRDANSPLTLERWQELYDGQLARGHETEADFWALGLLTGARIHEIIAITQDQIDLDAAEWRIPVSKTLAGIRMIPLTPMALDILRPRLSSSHHAFEWFGSDELSYRRWYARAQRARSSAGAKPRIETQHSTRSTFRTLAPRMAPASTPAGVVEAIMGHELGGQIASATKHYLRAFEPDAHAFMAHWRPAISIRQSRA